LVLFPFAFDVLTGNQIFPHRCTIAGVLPFGSWTVNVNLFHDTGQQDGRMVIAFTLCMHPLGLLSSLQCCLSLYITKKYFFFYFTHHNPNSFWGSSPSVVTLSDRFCSVADNFFVITPRWCFHWPVKNRWSWRSTPQYTERINICQQSTDILLNLWY